MRSKAKRLAALALAALLLCGCQGKREPEIAAPVESAAPPPSATPIPAPVLTPTRPSGDTLRRAGLLTALNALDAEAAMYARLGDLNGDGDEDILILGRHTFNTDYGVSSVGFCFSGIVWDGTQAQVIPFDSFEYLAAFGADSFGVYRDKDTGQLYAGYSFSMDNVSAMGFQNAAEYVPLGFECGYETPEDLAQWEDLTAALQSQVDARFALVDTITFPERQVNGYGIGEDFYWTQYWAGYDYDAEKPQLPWFYSTVGEVRRALSDESYGADAQTTLPFAPGELQLYFSSGVGGWGTELTLQGDGVFSGSYHDSDLGWSGEGYDSTVSVCAFSGRFWNVRKVNDYTWSMTLATLTTEGPAGEEWIEEQEGWRVRYVTAEPYGVYGGEEFLLYTPDAPCKALPEDFLSWHLAWGDDLAERDVLGCYGLFNVAEGSGFYS